MRLITKFYLIVFISALICRILVLRDIPFYLIAQLQPIVLIFLDLLPKFIHVMINWLRRKYYENKRKLISPSLWDDKINVKFLKIYEHTIKDEAEYGEMKIFFLSSLFLVLVFSGMIILGEIVLLHIAPSIPSVVANVMMGCIYLSARMLGRIFLKNIEFS